jgi:hypothetical protein
MLKRIIVISIFLLPPSLIWAFEKKTVEVNVHGVNYSENTFRFYILNSPQPDSIDGGELIGPFEAGGITCCATLPTNWQPGTKVKVKTIHWLSKHQENNSKEVHEVHQVEIPRYANNELGDLWILREPDGKISAVSSDLQPNHAHWPGKIKGWPVPSLEYRRAKWAISKKHEEDGVTAAVELLDELQRSPAAVAQKIWETEKKYDPKSVEGFSGPRDPRYWKVVEERISQGLAQTKQRLQAIEEARP